MSCWIALWVLAQVAVVAAAWVGLMLLLRDRNFHPSGERKDPPRDASNEIRAKQIEYHNTATYRIFEFFLKIALALLGGAAYLAQTPPSARTATLLLAGAWLLLLSAVVLSGGMLIHQKSKIERWPRRYRGGETLAWLELWFIQGMLLVGVGFLAWVVPMLTRAG